MTYLRFAVALILLLLTACMGVPENVQPVTGFDAERYLGRWYEVARLDHSFERNLTNVTAEYSFKEDGGIRVLNRGYKASDSLRKEAEGKAYFVNNNDTGYLKVSFFGPFYASYVIFELDQQSYQYAFVSGNSHDYLWLLSRTPRISEAVKQKFIERATALGFNTNALIWVDQSKSIFPDALPASYGGILPCADCPGIRYELNLFADQTFYLRTTYLEKGDPNRFDDIGRWELSGNQQLLLLDGGREDSVKFEPDGNLSLRKLDLSGQKIVSGQNDRLQRTEQFVALEPELFMSGLYQYMADAGSFTECSSGKRFPVAMEADNLALERAYLGIRRQPGEAILASLEGRIALRRNEDSGQSQAVLIPNRFISISPGQNCKQPVITEALINTYWKLIWLGEESIVLEENQREPHLILHTDQNRAAGFAGCNRFTGGYTLEGPKLRFSQMASTLMACGNGMDTEMRLHKVLEDTQGWNTIGKHLELYGRNGELLARFEAVALH